MRSDWVDVLSEEDKVFLKRFLLCSGTLKDLAADYGISYPTVRNRLDRLIAKVELIDAVRPRTRLEAELVAAYTDGRLDEPTLRALTEAYQADRRTPVREVLDA